MLIVCWRVEYVYLGLVHHNRIYKAIVVQYWLLYWIVLFLTRFCRTTLLHRNSEGSSFYPYWYICSLFKSCHSSNAHRITHIHKRWPARASRYLTAIKMPSRFPQIDSRSAIYTSAHWVYIYHITNIANTQRATIQCAARVSNMELAPNAVFDTYTIYVYIYKKGRSCLMMFRAPYIVLCCAHIYGFTYGPSARNIDMRDARDWFRWNCNDVHLYAAHIEKNVRARVKVLDGWYIYV